MAVLLVRKLWQNESTSPLVLPTLPDSAMQRLSKVTAVLTSEEACLPGRPPGRIGLRLAGSAGAVTVAAVQADSPAQQAQFVVGEQLLVIDGVVVTSMTPEQVAARLLGRSRSIVLVEVLRQSPYGRRTLRLQVP